MSTISTILAALLCATAPIAIGATLEPAKEATQSNFKLGKETISSVRQAYEKGEYDEFLKEMDQSYKEADLEGLIQMRQKPLPLDFQDKWEKQFSDLQKEKNKELLSSISDKDDSLFANKVRSLAANLSTPEQEHAISKLNALIGMAPKTGANEDENTLIDIDLKYEYLLLHVQMPNSETSPEQRHAQQIALRMAKMDEMVAASKKFQDHGLKQAVGIAKASLDQRLARNLDGADLNALVRSKAKPSTETEEKVYSILASYQEQFSDLMKEIDHATR